MSEAPPTDPEDAFEAIQAQPSAVQTLRRAVQTERVASAYLFDGPSGVGKGQTALALAKTMIAQGEVARGRDPRVALRRIDEGKHPDVRIFEPRAEGHRNIRVDFLREEILPYAEFAPFEASSAFLIFPEADVSFPEKHPESANALLKTLEEPKTGVTFVLLAERPDRLLPTIRSRAQRVRFRRLPIAEVEAICTRAGADAPLARAAAALSGGRADRALALCTDDLASELFTLTLAIDDAAAGTRPGPLLSVAQTLAKHDTLSLALESLSLFYRDITRVDLGFGDEHLVFRHQATEIRRRAERLDASRATTRDTLIREAQVALEANGNAQVVMDALVFDMRRAR